MHLAPGPQPAKRLGARRRSAFALRARQLQSGRDDAPTHLGRRRARGNLRYELGHHAALVAERGCFLDLLGTAAHTSVQVHLSTGRERCAARRSTLRKCSHHDPRRAVEVYRELIGLCPECARRRFEGRLHPLAALLVARLPRPARRHRRDTPPRWRTQPAAIGRAVVHRLAALLRASQDYEQCRIEAAKVVQKCRPRRTSTTRCSCAAGAERWTYRKPDAPSTFAELLRRFPVPT